MKSPLDKQNNLMRVSESKGLSISSRSSINKKTFKQWFKAAKNFTSDHGTVSDDGDFWYNMSLTNGSIIVMENGIFEERSSDNEVLYSTLDLNGTDMPLNLTEVL